MLMLVPGYPYVSKQALDRVAELTTAQRPHVTPDGRAILAIHTGGGPAVGVDGQPAEMPANEWVWHVLDADGLNVEHVVPGPGGRGTVVQTFRSPLDAFGDVERLVEYDHLPEARKDYSVYPRGHKLA